MYTTVKFLILISGFLMAQSQGPTEYFEYTLYTNSNFNGKTTVMRGSSTACIKIRIDGAGDNQMTSYWHNTGRACIIFYTSDTCGGSSFTGTVSNANIGSPWNDNIKSYRGCNPIPPTTRPTTTTTRPTTTTTRPTTTTTRPTTTTTRPTTTTTRPTTTTTRPTTTIAPTCPTCPTLPPPPTCPTLPPPPTCPTLPPPPTCPTLPPPPTCPTLPPPPTCPTLPPPPTCATPPSPSTTSKATTVESGPGVPFKCSEVGYWADTIECGVYHVCELYSGDWLDHKMNCPSTLVFCNDTKICDYNYNCPCDV